MQKTSILVFVIIMLLVIISVLMVQIVGSYQPSKIDRINTGASSVQFSTLELKTWLGIKDRLAVVNTDPNFSDPSHRVLQWISMRNSSSGDYYQKSMEFLCFWEGQGANGEWEAVVSIYNVPNVTNDFVVEVSRFTWNSLKVTLDDYSIATFPQVTSDTTSVGYVTFHVTPL
jgi:hypothetical protein